MSKKAIVFSGIVIMTIFLLCVFVITICNHAFSGVLLQPDSRTNETNAGIAADGKININTADAATLAELDGISLTTAERIVTYRNMNGPFQSKRELLNIRGIGEKTLDMICDSITLGG